MAETPEEKLLRIIESPTQPEKKNRGLGSVSGVKFAPKDLLKKLLRLNGKKIFKSINLVSINKGIAVLCCGATCFFVFDFFYQGKIFENKMAVLEKGGLNTLGWEAYVQVLKVDQEEILEKIKEKNMFNFVNPEPELPPEPVPVQQTVVNYTPVLQNLSLVGIIWSEISPQAIIEDTSKEKTYLLSVGDVIEVFTVKDITEDSVVLDKSGNEWILR